MAVADELQDFVKDGLARGLSRAEIENVLLQAGWPQEHVRGALAGFAEIEFPIPVPRPKPYLSAREAFMYLVLFSTLYISAFSLGRLLFQFINQGFPDPAAPPFVVESVRRAIRWSISSLIVAFPVFLYVSRLTGRETRLDRRKRASKVRRWLTYLTLFVAAGVLIGDVTSLVYNFLGGELTVRFILKVITIAVIAGTIFGYYLWDLRLEEKEAKP
ncbi:DUF5671 domain-containing protein [Acidobacteria bacterium AH-259-L09]|nr:DUF5671 domain-containing protein [Acidobacteria bacterium AH-259-L09]